MKKNICLVVCVVLFIITGCATPTPTSTPTSTVIPTETPAPTPTETPIPIPPLRGLAYSPYRDCQSPDTEITPSLDNVFEDLQTIVQMANGIRTYASTGINAKIPALARGMGLRVSAGAWLGKDKEANEREIEGLIEIAQTVDLEAVIVGNEVLLRGDLTEEELLAYIERVKAAVDVPVTTAEIGGILLAHPKVMDAVDFEMVHLYAYWDGITIENAARAVINDYRKIEAASNGKRVVIGETGWPSSGPTNGAAVCSTENQERFAKEFLSLAVEENVEYFYFDIFDEMWKTEGGVGPFWGLFYADRTPKYMDIDSVMRSFGVIPLPLSGADVTALATAQITSSPDETVPSDFYVYQDFGSERNHFAPGGWMGDIETLGLDICATANQTWPQTALEITYTPEKSTAEDSWAGMYWLEPDGNWGLLPNAGYDLSNYQQLIFDARAETPETQIRFFVGGVAKDEAGEPLIYPSSLESPLTAQEADPLTGFIRLSDEWQEYHIDLTGEDLSNIIDGFGWVTERVKAPDGAVIYLDNIRFASAPIGSSVTSAALNIYAGATLTEGFDMGVDTSGNRYDWVDDLNGAMQATYPSGQSWGVIYMTVGQPAAYGARASMDFSAYDSLSVEMRGETGGELVYIGIKDSHQYDDGQEMLIPVTLSDTWETYTFPLKDFRGALLSNIYLPIEFVFKNIGAETIYFKNVQYLP